MAREGEAVMRLAGFRGGLSFASETCSSLGALRVERRVVVVAASMVVPGLLCVRPRFLLPMECRAVLFVSGLDGALDSSLLGASSSLGSTFSAEELSVCLKFRNDRLGGEEGAVMALTIRAVSRDMRDVFLIGNEV